jgi:hypothetical protein
VYAHWGRRRRGLYALPTASPIYLPAQRPNRVRATVLQRCARWGVRDGNVGCRHLYCSHCSQSVQPARNLRSCLQNVHRLGSEVGRTSPSSPSPPSGKSCSVFGALDRLVHACAPVCEKLSTESRLCAGHLCYGLCFATIVAFGFLTCPGGVFGFVFLPRLVSRVVCFVKGAVSLACGFPQQILHL